VKVQKPVKNRLHIYTRSANCKNHRENSLESEISSSPSPDPTTS